MTSASLPEFQVVPAGCPHLATVRELLAEYGVWRNHDPALGDYATELHDLPGDYAPPTGRLLLARWRGEGAGCVALRPWGEATGEVKRLWVPARHRGNGLGRRLVETLIDEARAAGYARLVLDTHPRMAAARKVYRGCGFTERDRYNDNPTPGIRFFERSI